MNKLYSQDYCVIVDNNDRKEKRNELNKVLGQSGKDFNYFVLASIDFFYNDGAKQINIINDLLSMAQQSRGYNAGRLAAYLKMVIPHHLTESKDTSTAPKFTKKSGDYPPFFEVQLFTRYNPEWSKYGRVSKSTSFSEVNFLKLVVTKLHANKVNVGAFAQELVDADIAS